MFKLTGWFKGAMSAKHYDYLSHEADVLQSRLGIPCRMVSKADQHEEIVSDRFYGGMVEDDIGGFHASKFFAGFLRGSPKLASRYLKKLLLTIFRIMPGQEKWLSPIRAVFRLVLLWWLQMDIRGDQSIALAGSCGNVRYLSGAVLLSQKIWAVTG